MMAIFFISFLLVLLLYSGDEFLAPIEVEILFLAFSARKRLKRRAGLAPEN